MYFMSIVITRTSQTITFKFYMTTERMTLHDMRKKMILSMQNFKTAKKSHLYIYDVSNQDSKSFMAVLTPLSSSVSFFS